METKEKEMGIRMKKERIDDWLCLIANEEECWEAIEASVFKLLKKAAEETGVDFQDELADAIREIENSVKEAKRRIE